MSESNRIALYIVAAVVVAGAVAGARIGRYHVFSVLNKTNLAGDGELGNEQLPSQMKGSTYRKLGLLLIILGVISLLFTFIWRAGDFTSVLFRVKDLVVGVCFVCLGFYLRVEGKKKKDNKKAK